MKPLSAGYGNKACIALWLVACLIHQPANLRVSASDLALIHGKIVTVDPRNTLAEAMLVRGERILMVGSNQDILKAAPVGVRTLDLGGKTVLPGLIDSHTHPLGACMTEADHEIPEMRDLGDVLNYVQSRTTQVTEGDWIVVQQVFITRLQERRYPTRSELDRVAPRHPVIFRTGPDASLNSLALSQFKIDRLTVEPAGVRIERDASSGEITGIIRGWSALIELPESPKAAEVGDKSQRLLELFKDYNSVGLTGIIDRAATAESMELYRQIKESDRLTLRLGLSRLVGNQGSLSDRIDQIKKIADEPTTRNPDAMLRTLGIKMFLDGGMLTGSAYMLQPWGISRIYGIDDPDYRGLRFMNQEDLIELVSQCAQHGLQFTAHSVGDGAVTALVDAFEAVHKIQPLSACRPNITHCNFMTLEVIERMSHLGISADIQPAWLYLDAKTLSLQFEAGRMRGFQPLKTLFEKGVLFGGGSDHMQKIGSFRSINPYNPFLGMWIAVTRNARHLEQPLNPDQCLSIMQALRMYTINNAYLMFMEKETGSLETGKYADFVVVDRDILTIDLEEIPQTRVLATYLSGDCLYSVSDEWR